MTVARKGAVTLFAAFMTSAIGAVLAQVAIPAPEPGDIAAQLLRAVRVEKAAAVGSEFLDHFL